ncbi:PH domain-containing protein [Kineococcus sp. SYSU DK018]|uniref:PH domain-containing protein n=1 Tax=Kineococcus sp. SYSU DK018 TaxID=3383139 RepID=UPI003D7DEC6A
MNDDAVPSRTGSRARAADDAPFRPRRARAVGLPVAAVLGVVLAAIAVGLTLAPTTDWTLADSALTLLFGLLLCGGLVRVVSVRAVPTAEALVVRNVVFTHRVEWGAVVAVRFGGDDPWLLLDTDDGQELAVMAVQRSDGEHARAEARRLARLVESRAPRAPRS